MSSSSNIMTAEFENPFRLPPDEMVFLKREEQQAAAQAERDEQKSLPVWAKTTNSQRQQAIRRINDDDIIPGAGAVRDKRSKRTKGLVAAASAGISTERRREKENMTEFIMKKREMFLVQMSLDTKREEIRKLEEKAQMKEQALKKSELMLEEDAIRFDTFLKENDHEAHKAIKRAEAETKAKQEKVQEIKKLHQEIQAVQSEMSKLREHLDDCERYKTFLDDLTPEEYFQTQAQEKIDRATERMETKRGEIRGEWEKQCTVIQEEWEKQEAEEAEKRSKKKKKKRKNQTPRPEGPMFPAEPVFADSHVDYMSDTGQWQNKSYGHRGCVVSCVDSPCFFYCCHFSLALLLSCSLALLLSLFSLALALMSEPPMYFQEPAQLLNIFTALEEQNLFLIQNSQETEQALEELKQTFRSTKAEMDKKTIALKSNIKELDGQIAAEEEKADALRRRAKSSVGEDEQKKMLEGLKTKVQKTYETCGFDAESNPSTLTMLTDLEAKLEELLTTIEQMPEEYVERAEKAKERERRDRVRGERLEAQQEAQAEKMRISMRRSRQPPKRKTGKPVMMRSKPLFRRKKVEKVAETDEHAADAQYFA